MLSRAEATDVANAVLDGADGVLLGAETLRGKYPAVTIKTVLAICRQAEEVFDYSGHYEWLTIQGEKVSHNAALGAFAMTPSVNTHCTAQCTTRAHPLVQTIYTCIAALLLSPLVAVDTTGSQQTAWDSVQC